MADYAQDLQQVVAVQQQQAHMLATMSSPASASSASNTPPRSSDGGTASDLPARAPSSPRALPPGELLPAAAIPAMAPTHTLGSGSSRQAALSAAGGAGQLSEAEQLSAQIASKRQQISTLQASLRAALERAGTAHAAGISMPPGPQGESGAGTAAAALVLPELVAHMHARGPGVVPGSHTVLEQQQQVPQPQPHMPTNPDSAPATSRTSLPELAALGNSSGGAATLRHLILELRQKLELQARQLEQAVQASDAELRGAVAPLGMHASGLLQDCDDLAAATLVELEELQQRLLDKAQTIDDLERRLGAAEEELLAVPGEEMSRHLTKQASDIAEERDELVANAMVEMEELQQRLQDRDLAMEGLQLRLDMAEEALLAVQGEGVHEVSRRLTKQASDVIAERDELVADAMVEMEELQQRLHDRDLAIVGLQLRLDMAEEALLAVQGEGVHEVSRRLTKQASDIIAERDELVANAMVEMEELQQRLLDKDSTIEGLQLRLAAADEALLAVQGEDAHEVSRRLTKQASDIIAERDELVADAMVEMEELQQRLLDRDRTIEGLQLRLAAADEALLAVQGEDAHEVSCRLTKQASDIMAERDSLAACAALEMDELQQCLLDKDYAINELRRQLEAAEEEVQAADEEEMQEVSRRLSKQVSDIGVEHARKAAVAAQEMEELQQRLLDKEATVDALNRQLAAAMEELQAAQVEGPAEASRCLTLEQASDTMAERDALWRAVVEMEELRGVANARQASNEALQLELQALARQLDAVQTDQRAKEEQLDAMRADQRAKEEQLESFGSAILDLQAQVQQLDALRVAHADVQAELQAQVTQLDALLAAHSALRADQRAKEEQLESFGSAIMRLQAELQAKAQEQEALRDTSVGLQCDVWIKDAELEALRAAMLAGEEQVEALRSAVSRGGAAADEQAKVEHELEQVQLHLEHERAGAFERERALWQELKRLQAAVAVEQQGQKGGAVKSPGGVAASGDLVQRPSSASWQHPSSGDSYDPDVEQVNQMIAERAAMAEAAIATAAALKHDLLAIKEQLRAQLGDERGEAAAQAGGALGAHPPQTLTAAAGAAVARAVAAGAQHDAQLGSAGDARGSSPRPASGSSGPSSSPRQSTAAATASRGAVLSTCGSADVDEDGLDAKILALERELQVQHSTHEGQVKSLARTNAQLLMQVRGLGVGMAGLSLDVAGGGCQKCDMGGWPTVG